MSFVHRNLPPEADPDPVPHRVPDPAPGFTVPHRFPDPAPGFPVPVTVGSGRLAVIAARRAELIALVRPCVRSRRQERIHGEIAALTLLMLRGTRR